jgi:phosphatidylserine decarboxylase
MIQYVDRKTGAICTEKVYGAKALKLLYGDSFLTKIFSYSLLLFLTRIPFCSHIYGYFQKTASSRAKIIPFIQAYSIDSSEFETDQFSSFNDFFIRKLTPASRPIDPGLHTLVMPADGRYLVYPKFDRFFVKGQEFVLDSFLQDKGLEERYLHGSMAIARLCPVDYHRFHFPCSGIPSAPRLINGHLSSVNPIALKKRISILSENKRVVTEIETEGFGRIAFVEIGATSVGTIQQTFSARLRVEKGQEKGYFEFGGSCLVLLFEPNRVKFDADIVENTKKGLETLCLMGTSLGVS